MSRIGKPTTTVATGSRGRSSRSRRSAVLLGRGPRSPHDSKERHTVGLGYLEECSVRKNEVYRELFNRNSRTSEEQEAESCLEKFGRGRRRQASTHREEVQQARSARTRRSLHLPCLCTDTQTKQTNDTRKHGSSTNPETGPRPVFYVCTKYSTTVTCVLAGSVLTPAVSGATCTSVPLLTKVDIVLII